VYYVFEEYVDVYGCWISLVLFVGVDIVMMIWYVDGVVMVVDGLFVEFVE